MLAIALKAQKVWWVPSRDRNTYRSSFILTQWRPVDSREIYDMDHIQKFAAGACLDLDRNDRLHKRTTYFSVSRHT